MAIQTQIRDEHTNAMIDLRPEDKRYWTGPHVYVPYPKCLFRATGPQHQDIEEKVVKSEQEHTKAGSAWCESPDLARAYQAGLDAEVAREAAASNFSDRNMGELAKRERKAADDATDEMIVDVAAPKRGPGRPPKTA